MSPCLRVLLKVLTLTLQVLLGVPLSLSVDEMQYLPTEKKSIGDFSSIPGTTPGVAVNVGGYIKVLLLLFIYMHELLFFT